MPQLGKRQKWLIAIAITFVAVVGFGAVVVNTNTSTPPHAVKVTTKRNVRKHNPFQNLPANLQSTIKATDKATAQAIKAKINAKSAGTIVQALAAANGKAAKIKGATKTATDIRATYTNLLKVVDSPNIANLQRARTSLSTLSDTKVADYLTKAYTAKLVTIVATTTHNTVKVVRKASAQLSPAQIQAKKALAAKNRTAAAAKKKAAAENQANVKATTKTNVGLSPQPKSQSTSNNSTSQTKSSSQSNHRSTYSAPKQKTQSQTTHSTGSTPKRHPRTQSASAQFEPSLETHSSRTPTHKPNATERQYVKTEHGGKYNNDPDLPHIGEDLEWYELKK